MCMLTCLLAWKGTECMLLAVFLAEHALRVALSLVAPWKLPVLSHVRRRFSPLRLQSACAARSSKKDFARVSIMDAASLEALVWPLPAAAFPFALVAYVEAGAAAFYDALCQLLQQGPAALSTESTVSLSPAAASALHVKLAAAAAAGHLPAPRCGVPQDMRLLPQMAPLMMPLSTDSFPFALAAFFDAMPAAFFSRMRDLLADVDSPDLRVFSPDIAEALRAKLLAFSGIGLLPAPWTRDSHLRLGLASTSCPLCGAVLTTLPPLLGTVLCFDSGGRRLRCDRAACTTCAVTCVGVCWTAPSRPGLHLLCAPATITVLPLTAGSEAACSSPNFVCFLDVKLLHFLTYAVLHWRISARIWEQMWGDRISHRLAHRVFHVWLYWRVQCLLADDRLSQDARAIALPANNSDDSHPGFYSVARQLTGLLRSWFLHRYGRLHSCDTCSRMRSVGVDNKVNLSARMCAFPNGAPRCYREAGVAVDFGCTEFPAPGQHFCRYHMPLPDDAASVDDLPFLCPLDHALKASVVPEDGFAYTCDICSTHLPAGFSFYTCVRGCEYDVCLRCRAPATQAQPEACGHPRWLLEERQWDVCGLAKALPKAGCRRTGGVLSYVLACGTVCHLSACAGAESATQIFGLLGEIRVRRSINFVVYDNACMLARFVRNKSARSRLSIPPQLATDCFYVLDRFHRRNHTACLNPRHRLYLPEVDIDRYPALALLNTSQNEQWNFWLGQFSHTVRHMRLDTLELYLLVVADLWNTLIVPLRKPAVSAAVASPPAAPKAVASPALLKRDSDAVLGQVLVGVRFMPRTLRLQEDFAFFFVADGVSCLIQFARVDPSPPLRTKEGGFQAIARALGVEINLSDSAAGLFKEVHEEVVSALNVDSKKGFTYEMEAYAAIHGVIRLCQKLRNVDLIVYCDNQATVAALIKSSSEAPVVRGLLVKLNDVETSLGINSWFERVASAANPADAPSRDSTADLPWFCRIRWHPTFDASDLD
ncbi:hypothetical protein AK812_SmicGene42902 [Symbiodinium microadriaticum]|uniref:Uncharacterized protein n=1 Tax=Symbiodinium microadriaticum TaxID=2951 RepID=A0A1Q9C2D0_SYMMI|nr:hypothetical protein AK812_SmicGene42902 [Symbiodinium microadriaticum]